MEENTPEIICNHVDCQTVVDFDEAEYCWYCLDYLCYDCWDNVGHCGHIEAGIMTRNARANRRLGVGLFEGKMNRAITRVSKKRKQEQTVDSLRTQERPFSPKKKANFDDNGRLKF